MTTRSGPTIVKDPAQEVGRYQLKENAVGRFFVYDPDAPFACRGGQWTFKTLDAARKEAERLVAEGSPVRDPDVPPPAASGVRAVADDGADSRRPRRRA